MSVLMDFAEQTVVVTGTASGMGAAIARQFLGAGADVFGLDIADPPPDIDANPAYVHYHCDLGSEQATATAVARLPQAVDVLVNSAGVPNGGRFSPQAVMQVNWFGLRRLTEAILARMQPGAAVVHVGSTAGRDWARNQTALDELMAIGGASAEKQWLTDHAQVVGDGYAWSKQAVQYYTMWRAVQLLPAGVRMNAVNPGVTDTSLVSDFRAGLGDDLIDHAIAIAGRMAQPIEIAPIVVFLADRASASYITGVNVNVDHGTAAARLTNQDDPSRIWGG